MSPQQKDWLKRKRRFLLIVGPFVILLAVAYFYFFGGRYVSTDDAYIQAARTQISANVSARVVEIAVHDNQQVKKGDLLFKLDDREFAIGVRDAEAQLAQARLKIAALKATYLQRQADVQAAQDTLSYQQTELDRQTKLQQQGISSQAKLDETQHAFANAQQALSSAEQQRANTVAELGGNPDIDVDQHPLVQAAQAALDRAQLDLGYTTVLAPADGVVTKVEQLQVGQYVHATTPLFALVSDTDIWVEANFKETELENMQPGQPAEITVDTYGGHTFHGTVDSTSPGTGASFSLLPPENASGNWVKVVQRVPVRISIEHADHDVTLHAGLSAIVDVDTGKRRYERLLSK